MKLFPQDVMDAFAMCLRQWRMHIEENNQDDLEVLAKSGECLEAEMCLNCVQVYNIQTQNSNVEFLNSTQQAKACHNCAHVLEDNSICKCCLIKNEYTKWEAAQ